MKQGGIIAIISKTPLDVRGAYEAVADDANGAADVFIGAVRNNHQGKPVTGITYDVHETLAEGVFHDICAGAQARWPMTRYYVAHYSGYLDVGGISVIIAVGSPHRAEAFDACRYVIEEIKKRAPVWKKEHYIDGESAWLPGHSLSDGPEQEVVLHEKSGTHG